MGFITIRIITQQRETQSGFGWQKHRKLLLCISTEMNCSLAKTKVLLAAEKYPATSNPWTNPIYSGGVEVATSTCTVFMIMCDLLYFDIAGLFFDGFLKNILTEKPMLMNNNNNKSHHQIRFYLPIPAVRSILSQGNHNYYPAFGY